MASLTNVVGIGRMFIKNNEKYVVLSIESGRKYSVVVGKLIDENAMFMGEKGNKHNVINHTTLSNIVPVYAEQVQSNKDVGNAVLRVAKDFIDNKIEVNKRLLWKKILDIDTDVIRNGEIAISTHMNFATCDRFGMPHNVTVYIDKDTSDEKNIESIISEINSITDPIEIMSLYESAKRFYERYPNTEFSKKIFNTVQKRFEEIKVIDSYSENLQYVANKLHIKLVSEDAKQDSEKGNILQKLLHLKSASKSTKLTLEDVIVDTIVNGVKEGKISLKDFLDVSDFLSSDIKISIIDKLTVIGRPDSMKEREIEYKINEIVRKIYEYLQGPGIPDEKFEAFLTNMYYIARGDIMSHNFISISDINRIIKGVKENYPYTDDTLNQYINDLQKYQNQIQLPDTLKRVVVDKMFFSDELWNYFVDSKSMYEKVRLIPQLVFSDNNVHRVVKNFRRIYYATLLYQKAFYPQSFHDTLIPLGTTKAMFEAIVSFDAWKNFVIQRKKPYKVWFLMGMIETSYRLNKTFGMVNSVKDSKFKKKEINSRVVVPYLTVNLADKTTSKMIANSALCNDIYEWNSEEKSIETYLPTSFYNSRRINDKIGVISFAQPLPSSFDTLEKFFDPKMQGTKEWKEIFTRVIPITTILSIKRPSGFTVNRFYVPNDVKELNKVVPRSLLEFYKKELGVEKVDKSCLLNKEKLLEGILLNHEREFSRFQMLDTDASGSYLLGRMKMREPIHSIEEVIENNRDQSSEMNL